MEFNKFYIAKVDYYYLAMEYSKNGRSFQKFHTKNHRVLMRRLDNDNVEISDSFYGFFGIVSWNTIMKSFVDDKPFLEFYDIVVDDKNEIIKIFNEENPSSKEEICINGVIYDVNKKAMETFIDDLDYHINVLMSENGLVGIILFARIMQSVYLMKQSYVKFIKLMGIKQKLDVLEKSSTLWRSIDVLCDKLYLKNSTETETVAKLKGLLIRIFEIEYGCKYYCN